MPAMPVFVALCVANALQIARCIFAFLASPRAWIIFKLKERAQHKEATVYIYSPQPA